MDPELGGSRRGRVLLVAGAGNRVVGDSRGEVPFLEGTFQPWDGGAMSVGEDIHGHDRLTVEGTAELHPGGMEVQARQAGTRQAAGEVALEVEKRDPVVGMGASWCQEWGGSGRPHKFEVPRARRLQKHHPPLLYPQSAP